MELCCIHPHLTGLVIKTESLDSGFEFECLNLATFDWWYSDGFADNPVQMTLRCLSKDNVSSMFNSTDVITQCRLLFDCQCVDVFQPSQWVAERTGAPYELDMSDMDSESGKRDFEISKSHQQSLMVAAKQRPDCLFFARWNNGAIQMEILVEPKAVGEWWSEHKSNIQPMMHCKINQRKTWRGEVVSVLGKQWWLLTDVPFSSLSHTYTSTPVLFMKWMQSMMESKTQHIEHYTRLILNEPRYHRRLINLLWNCAFQMSILHPSMSIWCWLALAFSSTTFELDSNWFNLIVSNAMSISWFMIRDITPVRSTLKQTQEFTKLVLQHYNIPVPPPPKSKAATSSVVDEDETFQDSETEKKSEPKDATSMSVAQFHTAFSTKIPNAHKLVFASLYILNKSGSFVCVVPECADSIQRTTMYWARIFGFEKTLKSVAVKDLQSTAPQFNYDFILRYYTRQLASISKTLGKAVPEELTLTPDLALWSCMCLYPKLREQRYARDLSDIILTRPFKSNRVYMCCFYNKWIVLAHPCAQEMFDLDFDKVQLKKWVRQDKPVSLTIWLRDSTYNVESEWTRMYSLFMPKCTFEPVPVQSVDVQPIDSGTLYQSFEIIPQGAHQPLNYSRTAIDAYVNDCIEHSPISFAAMGTQVTCHVDDHDRLCIRNGDTIVLVSRRDWNRIVTEQECASAYLGVIRWQFPQIWKLVFGKELHGFMLDSGLANAITRISGFLKTCLVTAKTKLNENRHLVQSNETHHQQPLLQLADVTAMPVYKFCPGSSSHLTFGLVQLAMVAVIRSYLYRDELQLVSDDPCGVSSLIQWAVDKQWVAVESDVITSIDCVAWFTAMSGLQRTLESSHAVVNVMMKASSKQLPFPQFMFRTLYSAMYDRVLRFTVPTVEMDQFHNWLMIIDPGCSFFEHCPDVDYTWRIRPSVPETLLLHIMDSCSVAFVRPCSMDSVLLSPQIPPIKNISKNNCHEIVKHLRQVIFGTDPLNAMDKWLYVALFYASMSFKDLNYEWLKRIFRSQWCEQYVIAEHADNRILVSLHMFVVALVTSVLASSRKLRQTIVVTDKIPDYLYVLQSGNHTSTFPFRYWIQFGKYTCTGSNLAYGTPELDDDRSKANVIICHPSSLTDLESVNAFCVICDHTMEKKWHGRLKHLLGFSYMQWIWYNCHLDTHVYRRTFQSKYILRTKLLLGPEKYFKSKHVPLYVTISPQEKQWCDVLYLAHSDSQFSDKASDFITSELESMMALTSWNPQAVPYVIQSMSSETREFLVDWIQKYTHGLCGNHTLEPMYEKQSSHGAGVMWQFQNQVPQCDRQWLEPILSHVLDSSAEFPALQPSTLFKVAVAILNVIVTNNCSQVQSDTENQWSEEKTVAYEPQYALGSNGRIVDLATVDRGYFEKRWIVWAGGGTYQLQDWIAEFETVDKKRKRQDSPWMPLCTFLSKWNKGRMLYQQWCEVSYLMYVYLNRDSIKDWKNILIPYGDIAGCLDTLSKTAQYAFYYSTEFDMSSYRSAVTKVNIHEINSKLRYVAKAAVVDGAVQMCKPTEQWVLDCYPNSRYAFVFSSVEERMTLEPLIRSYCSKMQIEIMIIDNSDASLLVQWNSAKNSTKPRVILVSNDDRELLTHFSGLNYVFSFYQPVGDVKWPSGFVQHIHVVPVYANGQVV